MESICIAKDIRIFVWNKVLHAVDLIGGKMNNFRSLKGGQIPLALAVIG